MTKNTKARKSEFIKWFGPILDALRDLGGSARPKEVTEWIGEKFNLSENILNERHEKSGVLKFQNQLAWARQYLVWEELLSSSKYGVWALSHKGWETHLNEEQARAIFLKWVKIFQDMRDGKSGASTTIDTQSIVEIQDELEPSANNTSIKPTLLEVLQSLSPKGFEQLCGRLLREYDFENIEITQMSHDGGIDGYANLKLNPFVNMSVYFQCKRYSGTVPTEKVQAFIGVMETNKRSVEKGLIITTGTFAKAALDIERNNIKLELIDGEKLVEMFEKKELGVTPRVVYEPDLSFFEQFREK
ncbi:MAG: restriction endonuclease [Bacteroidia bacterium]|jgi:restriction system protein